MPRGARTDSLLNTHQSHAMVVFGLACQCGCAVGAAVRNPTPSAILVTIIEMARLLSRASGGAQHASVRH